MDAPARAPWNPSRSWADPAILLLALVALLFVSEALARGRKPKPPAERISLAGRAQELQAAAQQLLAPGRPLPRASQPPAGWDRALASVLAAESGDVAQGRALALEGPTLPGPGEAFRRAWQAAYLDQAHLSPQEREAVLQALGKGWAARHLEARLAPEGDRQALREAARAWARPRLATFALASVLGVVLALGGLVGLPLLAFTRPRNPPALPAWAMPWRAALMVLLLWFLSLRLSGLVASLILAVVPLPRPWLLPLAFLTHAAAGLGLLAWAEGRSLRTVLGGACAGRPLRAFGWGGVFLAIALAAVVAAGLAFAPLLGPGEPPQRELMDLIGGSRGLGTTLALFLTVAVLAPVFEEILFRGFLLPWLQPRLTARWGLRWGTAAALLLTALAFGAMHLQPRGLHILSTLGLVLGWAMVRTGDLRTAILVHGAWNGGVFLLVRSLL